MKKSPILPLTLMLFLLTSALIAAGCVADTALPPEVTGTWYGTFNPEENSWIVFDVAENGTAAVTKFVLEETGTPVSLGTEDALVTANGDGTYTFANLSAGGSVRFELSADKQSFTVPEMPDLVYLRTPAHAGVPVSA